MDPRFRGDDAVLALVRALRRRHCADHGRGVEDQCLERAEVKAVRGAVGDHQPVPGHLPIGPRAGETVLVRGAVG